jgi:hypothetical protein
MLKSVSFPETVAILLTVTLCAACSHGPRIETGSLAFQTKKSTAEMDSAQAAHSALVVQVIDRNEFKIEGAGPTATTSIRVASWIAAELFCRENRERPASRLRHARLINSDKAPSASSQLDHPSSDMHFRCVFVRTAA